MPDPDELLGLAERDDDPVPALTDERLEAMLEWALRSDAEPDPALVPPGDAPFGEADGAVDAAPWRTEPDESAQRDEAAHEDGERVDGEPADDAAADAFGAGTVGRLDDPADVDAGEHDGGESWSEDS